MSYFIVGAITAFVTWLSLENKRIHLFEIGVLVLVMTMWPWVWLCLICSYLFDKKNKA
jgi:hypothetical protein